MQIVCGVLDPSDPAIAVVRALQAEHPDFDISLVIDDAIEGANLKISNLVHIAKAARHGLLVASDADIAVGPKLSEPHRGGA